MALSHRIRPAAIALIAVAATAATLLAGCGSDNGRDAGQHGQSAEMEHIHGLGVDPADGTLYAATHYGLFQIRGSGEPTLVGDHVQDFMGFTVVGPNHFLASGHPGEGQGGPSSVGLIESTDAGRTWEPLSLSGEADFHSLDSVDGTIYGLDAMTGQLMTSTDGRTWQVRSTEAIADLAIDPRKSSTLIATTEQGPVISHDSGTTFAPLSGTPLLVFVDWATDGTLAGVAPNGAVYLSTDRGATWDARGTLPGPPEAVDIEDADTLYAATNGKVWRSVDGAEAFAEVPASD